MLQEGLRYTPDCRPTLVSKGILDKLLHRVLPLNTNADHRAAAFTWVIEHGTMNCHIIKVKP